MADTDITFTGLYYMRNQTVSVCIAGLDCGDFVVDGIGQVVVPIDSHPALSSDYLATVAARALDGPNMGMITIGEASYLVPISIGRAYTSKGQILRPILQDEIKSPTGGGLGKRRRGYQYSFMFSRAAMGQGDGALSVGTDFNILDTVNLKTPTDEYTTWPDTAGYNGVHWAILTDHSSFDTQLCWQVSRPVPLIINAHSLHIDSEDR